MKGIVLIPAFDRPAFLQICVDHILRADEADQYRYIFALDSGHDRKNYDVIKAFPLNHAILERKTKIIGIAKQSNNVLMGMKCALENCDGGTIHYIEDDVFIGKDYFTFTEEVLRRQPGVLCCVASMNVNDNDPVTDDLNAYYVKQTNQYQGIGAAFNSDVYRRYVLPHICTEYVTNPRGYCATMFPLATLGLEFCEQDGLMRRIIQQNNLEVAFCHVPRCFHGGFFGYHRVRAKHIQKLPVDAQIRRIYDIAFNIENLRKVAEHENLVRDSMPVNLDTSHTDCIFKPLNQ